MKLQASILLVSLAGLAAAQNITLHTVVVGSNGKLVFNPDTVIANVGDLIRFEYDPAVRVTISATESPAVVFMRLITILP